MILLVFLSFTSFIGCDKLDRTYLPPPGSKLAGGSPGAILAPPEQLKSEQFIQGTTVRPQTPSIFYTPTTARIGQPDIEPGIGYKTSNINISPGYTLPGTYNVPTTTTSYAFTQTTTYAPITCTTPDCALDTKFQTQFDSPNYVAQQGFPQKDPNLQQSEITVIRPGTNRPDGFVPPKEGLYNVPFQQVTSQRLPSGFPAFRQQGQSRLQPNTVSGTLDGLSQQPIQTYSNGEVSEISPGYSQSTNIQNIPSTQTNIYEQTNLQQPSKAQTLDDYNRPDAIQNNLFGGTNVPGSKENIPTPSLFNRTPVNKVQSFRSQNVSNIPDFDNLNMQTSTPITDSNAPSLNYPSSISSSGYSSTAAPKQFDRTTYDTSSRLQPNTEFSDIRQPNIPSSTLKERRPVRPQAEFERNAGILNYENILTPEGFSYSFDTGNGIHADESGTAIDGVKAQGAFSYTGDDGKLYSIVYSADENGYQPIGDHLPTPPPIPEAILRVIQQSNQDKESGISDDGSYDDTKYGYKSYQGAMDRYNPQNYRPYGPTSREQLVGSNDKAEQGNADYNKPEADKSYKESDTFKEPLSKSSDLFRPDIYRPQTQQSVNNQVFYQDRERYPSDIQIPGQVNYSDNRKFIDDSSKYTDLKSSRYPNQQLVIEGKTESNIVRGNVPEEQYNDEYYGVDQQSGIMRKPLRPKMKNNENISINSRVTPDSLSTQYTPTTFRPVTTNKYKPLKGKDDKVREFLDDQDQNYEYKNVEQKDRLNTQSAFRRPSVKVKKPLHFDGYAYLPPSQKFQPKTSAQSQNDYEEASRFPLIAPTRGSTAGATDYKVTTLRPFMTPNASPSRTSLDYDSDESFSTTYPTRGPSQVSTYTSDKDINIPTYKTTNYTDISKESFTNQNDQALTTRPELTSAYVPKLYAGERQYPGFKTSGRIDAPNQYEQYTESQQFSQGTQRKTSPMPITPFFNGRDQNIRQPVDRLSQKDIPGQINQNVYPQNIDATVKPQYIPTQTSKEYQKQYTTPIEYGETQTAGPVQEVGSRTPLPKYSSTQSKLGLQKNYEPQQPQYTQSVTQTEESPTTYRPFIENLDSSTAIPAYSISPTKAFGSTRPSSSQQVPQSQISISQPNTGETGGTKIISGLSTRYPVASEDGSRPDDRSYGKEISSGYVKGRYPVASEDGSRPDDRSYGKEISSGYIKGRPTTETVYRPEEVRKTEESDVSSGRFDYTKPISGSTQFQVIADRYPQGNVEDSRIYDQNRQIIGQGDRFTPGQIVKGETFSGPKQPPRFDTETGYYY